MANLGHMGAQLVRAAGHGFQRHPGQPLAQKPQREVVGMRALGVRVVGHLGGMDADHLFPLAAPAPARSLFQPELDRPLPGMRHTCNDGPIDLAGGAVAQGFGQRTRHAVGAGQHQKARGVLVQPVHQFRLFLVAELQGFGQAIDMPVALSATTL